MTTRQILILAAAVVIFAIGGVVGCQTHAHFNPADAVPLIGKNDTITVRDTVEIKIPFPVRIEPAGTVTIKPRTNSDTVQIASNSLGGTKIPKPDDTPILKPSGDVDIPIEKKVYKGDDFYAVVSGWRPSLDSLKVYPKTTTITKEVIKMKRPVLSITLGPTALYDGKLVRGGIGITAGFTILSR